MHSSLHHESCYKIVLCQRCSGSKKNFDPIYRIYVDLKKKNSIIDNFESQNKNCPFIFDTIKTYR